MNFGVCLALWPDCSVSVSITSSSILRESSIFPPTLTIFSILCESLDEFTFSSWSCSWEWELSLCAYNSALIFLSLLLRVTAVESLTTVPPWNTELKCLLYSSALFLTTWFFSTSFFSSAFLNILGGVGALIRGGCSSFLYSMNIGSGDTRSGILGLSSGRIRAL